MLISPLVIVAMLAAAPTFPEEGTVPAVDGRFNEWGELPVAYGPTGGPPLPGPFAVQRMETAGEGTRLWVALDFARAFNLQSGPSWEGPLCVEVRLPDDRRLSVDLRSRRIDLPGVQRAPRWTDVALITAPTTAAERFELRMDLGGYLHAGDSVDVSVHSDAAITIPVTTRFSGALPPPALRSTDRERGTCVRIANLNTHLDGFVDTSSKDALGRLTRAVAADIYCFQEQWKTPAEEIARRLNELAPGSKAAWSVHKVDGCIIATHGTLEPVPAGDDRHAAAIIRVGPEPPLLVVSVHPKCCGYAGSDEDHQRIEQALTIARTIRHAQSTNPGLPVVVIGDWNLVGSEIPLDVVRGAVDPALVRWPLRHLASTDEYTFHDAKGSFPPGLLDIVAHSPILKRRNGFVLDSTTLPSEMLQRLGLERGDSRATDHMLIVADFTLPD